MTIQLTIDEMLEILRTQDHPKFPRMKERAEELATALAAYVMDAVPQLLMQGYGRTEPPAFGGTCAPFRPREVGPVPACLLNMDVEVQEWQGMCLAMAETVEL